MIDMVLELLQKPWGWIFSCLWMTYEWVGQELEWALYDLEVFSVICEWARHELWMRWSWILRDNDLSSCLIKNSSKKFIWKWEQAGNEL